MEVFSPCLAIMHVLCHIVLGLLLGMVFFLLGRVYMGFKPFKSSKMDNAMKIDLMISSCHGLSPISMMI